MTPAKFPGCSGRRPAPGPTRWPPRSRASLTLAASPFPMRETRCSSPHGAWWASIPPRSGSATSRRQPTSLFARAPRFGSPPPAIRSRLSPEGPSASPSATRPRPLSPRAAAARAARDWIFASPSRGKAARSRSTRSPNPAMRRIRRRRLALIDFLLRPSVDAEATAAAGLASAEAETSATYFRGLWPVGVYYPALVPVIEKEWARVRAPARASSREDRDKPASKPARAKERDDRADRPISSSSWPIRWRRRSCRSTAIRSRRAPNMQALAQSGVVFESAYCASPLCSPSRASFMAGLLPSRTRVYDNAAEFAADIPTFAHHLRLARISDHPLRQDAFLRARSAARLRGAADDRHLSGRLRLDARLGPSGRAAELVPQHEFGRSGRRLRAHRTSSTSTTRSSLPPSARSSTSPGRTTSGPSCSSLRSPIRTTRSRCRSVTGTSIATSDIEMPSQPIAPEMFDPHSRRLRHVCAMDAEPVTEVQARNARHAYFGAISYVDDNFGRLMQALALERPREDTIVILLSDHGEMLGERGLWYKMSFFEGASRVPLVVASPGRFAPRPRRRERVAGRRPSDARRPCRRRRRRARLVDRRAKPRARISPGRAGHDEAVGEYLAEGAVAPIVMIRRGAFKFIHSPSDPDQLYDLARDPGRARQSGRQAEHMPSRSPSCAPRSRAAGISRRSTRKCARASVAAGWSTRR